MDIVKDNKTDLTSRSAQVSNQSFLQNNTTSITSAPSLSFEQYIDLSNTLFTVIIPILLILGTFGNVMTVLVMRRLSKSLGNRVGDFSMYVYFPCLAIGDQIVLTIGLTRKWFKALLFLDIRKSHDIICKLHKFLVYAVSRAASWILVAVALQRVLTVLWPLHQRRKRTKLRAIIAVVVITAACCSLDSSVFVLFSLQEKRNGTKKCQIVTSSPEQAYYALTVYPILRIITGSVLPLFILIVSNIILVYKTRQSAKALKMHHGIPTIKDTDARKSDSFTRAVIVTSLAFFVLTAPIIADFFINFKKPKSLSRGVLILLDTIGDLLSYGNNVFNFYLYILAGRTFRHAAIRYLCGEKSPQSLTSTMSERRPGGNETKARPLRSFIQNISQI